MYALLLLFAVQPDEEKTVLRYLKPSGDKFVLESEVTITKSKRGALYVSRTVRGSETMTLRIERGLAGQLLQATIDQQKGEVKAIARAEPKDGKLRVTRREVVEE